MGYSSMSSAGVGRGCGWGIGGRGGEPWKSDGQLSVESGESASASLSLPDVRQRISSMVTVCDRVADWSAFEVP